MHKPKNFGGCVVMLSKGKSLLKRSLRWQVVAGLICLVLVPLIIVGCGVGGGAGGGGAGGGGAGGGLTVPITTEEQVQRCFSLTQGSQWVYSETREQKFNTTLGESHTLTLLRGITTTVPGTYSGAPFSQEVVIWQEHHVGPKTIDGKTEQSDGYHRNFWTNLGGEVKLWGSQD
jgi:hypothetical protein